MGLNIIELSDVMQYIDTIEDKRIHDLLHKMRFEYGEYTDIGTVEDCKNYKKLCDIPMSQVNVLLQMSNKVLIDEIDALKKEIKMLKICKGDSPRKDYNAQYYEEHKEEISEKRKAKRKEIKEK